MVSGCRKAPCYRRNTRSAVCDVNHGWVFQPPGREAEKQGKQLWGCDAGLRFVLVVFLPYPPPPKCV